MTIVARRLTQEDDGIPGYMAHPDAPGHRPGVLMVHHVVARAAGMERSPGMDRLGLGPETVA